MYNIQSVVGPDWKQVQLIGQGSFGSVYELEKIDSEKTEKAALKVIEFSHNDIEYSSLSEKDDNENEWIKCITEIYSLIQTMNSPYHIKVDDVYSGLSDDGQSGMVVIKMELLAGLNKTLERELPDRTILKIARDLCMALIEYEDQGTFHGGVNPNNIFVSPQGDYKLGDPDIGKKLEGCGFEIQYGLNRYEAPEFYDGYPYKSISDIYSLGLVLYRLMNELCMPFVPLPPQRIRPMDEENARRRRLNGESLPAPIHGSEDLKQIVLKACAYEPKDRYQSVREMLEALQNVDLEKTVLENTVGSEVTEGNVQKKGKCRAIWKRR